MHIFPIIIAIGLKINLTMYLEKGIINLKEAGKGPYFKTASL